MRDLSNTCKIAVVQAAPVMFDKDGCVEKVLRYIDECADHGAELIVFPELFIPCYPFGLTFGFRVGSRNQAGREDWKKYYDNSILADGPEMQKIIDKAVTRGVYVSVGYSEREPLNGTLHIFGQQRLSDTTAPLCVDYNNTRYYTYAVWTDGVNLSRDYAPCIDAEGKPAFYDRVARNYIYPIGDKAEFVAEFTGNVGTNSVYVTGENEKGEPAAYLDPDATALGYHQIAVGNSETFTATGRMVFGRKVKGYRIDTWTDGTGWEKGAVQSGYTATLGGEKSFRRLVWLWGKSAGLTIFVR